VSKRREMHHRVGAGKQPVPLRKCGDVAEHVAPQRDDFVPALAQQRTKPLADEAARAGDDDPHLFTPATGRPPAIYRHIPFGFRCRQTIA